MTPAGLPRLLALMLLAGAAPLVTASDLLRDYAWQNRVLLLFTPSADHPGYRRQLDILANWAPGLDERDLVLFHLRPGATVSIDNRIDSGASSDDLYRRFGVDAGEFRVILVGKDGTAKLERDRAVAVESLFALIDAMPMRQREMAKQAN